MTSRVTSEGITLLSWLILAHASDQIPPADFGCPYFKEKLAFPDIISAILAQMPGPLLRSVLLVLLLASSQKTTASPQKAQVRGTVDKAVSLMG